MNIQDLNKALLQNQLGLHQAVLMGLDIALDDLIRRHGKIHDYLYRDFGFNIYLETTGERWREFYYKREKLEMKLKENCKCQDMIIERIIEVKKKIKEIEQQIKDGRY